MYVDEVDAFFEKAVAAGAGADPVADQFMATFPAA